MALNTLEFNLYLIFNFSEISLGEASHVLNADKESVKTKEMNYLAAAGGGTKKIRIDTEKLNRLDEGWESELTEITMKTLV